MNNFDITCDVMATELLCVYATETTEFISLDDDSRIAQYMTKTNLEFADTVQNSPEKSDKVDHAISPMIVDSQQNNVSATELATSQLSTWRSALVVGSLVDVKSNSGAWQEVILIVAVIVFYQHNLGMYYGTASCLVNRS